MADDESTNGAGSEPAVTGGAHPPPVSPPEDEPADEMEAEPAAGAGPAAAPPEDSFPEPVEADAMATPVTGPDDEGAPAGAAEPEPAPGADPEADPEADPDAEREPLAAAAIEPETEAARDGTPEAFFTESAPDRDEAEEAAATDNTPAAATDVDAAATDVDSTADGIDRIDAVLLEVERVNVRMEELTRLSRRHVEHIDRLHAENQQLRAGELRQAISPLLRALVRHHDNVAKMGETAEAGSSEAKALDIVRSGLLSVLNMAGVDAFEVAAKEKFDPSRHQGVSRAETDDVDLDGTVAQMRRCGFVADDGRVLRPAEVDVYRLR